MYLTTPAEATKLEASPVHAELKRGVSPSPHQKRDEKERDTRSLFEKYEFFNAGMSNAPSRTLDVPILIASLSHFHDGSRLGDTHFHP